MTAAGGDAMDRDVLLAIREMLGGHRVLSLAVTVDGSPDASLLPYAVRPDFGAVYVQASGLARHARGLQPGATVGVLIHAGDDPAGDPLQIARLTVQATVAVLDKDGPAFAEASRRFIGRFSAAEMTLAMDDFNLYELTLGRGRFVAGFARALNIGPDTFAEIATVSP
jgi:putative heme iron utilization protein